MLKLVRRNKSPYWIIRGSIKGQRIEESTGTSDQAARRGNLCEARGGNPPRAHLRSCLYGDLRRRGPELLEARWVEAVPRPVIEHFATTPLAKIDLVAIERGARKLFPNGSPGDAQSAILHARLRGASSRGQARHVRRADHRATEGAEGPGQVDNRPKRPSG